MSHTCHTETNTANETKSLRCLLCVRLPVVSSYGFIQPISEAEKTLQKKQHAFTLLDLHVLQSASVNHCMHSSLEADVDD